MATWGSMLKAPGNIAGNVTSGVGKAIKYTIYGAVICGLAVALNQFATNAFGIDNFAAKGVDWVGDNVGPYVMKLFNWLTSWLNVAAASEQAIGSFIGGTAAKVGEAATATDAVALKSAGAIGTIQSWSNWMGETVAYLFSGSGKIATSRAGDIVDNVKLTSEIQRQAQGIVSAGIGRDFGGITGITADQFNAATDALTKTVGTAVKVPVTDGMIRMASWDFGPAKTVANATLAAGGTAAVVGTTVGKWQAMEDQRRSQRAQALQQLG